MRHRKHNHLLGVKTAHRTSLVANMSCSLIENGRIKTTLAKARALRPSIEKAITLAKKANASDDVAKKVHYRRQAIARLRSKSAVKKLFDELVEQFVGRNGGYTRIYKLAIPRLGDAADMAIIEFVEAIQEKKAKKKRTSKKPSSSKSNSKPLADKKADAKDADKKADAKDADKKADAKDADKKADAKDADKKADAKDAD
jgi:large subunit ribosomal protein L17